MSAAPPRFRVAAAEVRAGRVRLTGGELHHLRVRRLAPGAAVRLFDETGVEYEATVCALGDDHAEIAVCRATSPVRESPLRLTLAQAVLKGPHLDQVIEKATELGAAEILVFASARSVPRPTPTRLARWQRIAAAAAKQSGRTLLPALCGPLEFDEVVARARTGATIVFQPGAPGLRSASFPGAHEWGPAAAEHGNAMTVVVGPEGGFAPPEIAALAGAGCVVAGLGPRTLRAESGALVAVALVQFLWGDLGRVE